MSGRLLLLVIFLGALSAGCHTVPTPVPVQEIQDARSVAGDSASKSGEVVGQAEDLAGDLEGLPVPELVKVKARDLVTAAKAAAAAAGATVEKVAAVAPAVETIAGERAQAIVGEQKAEEKARAAGILSGKLIAALVAVGGGIIFLLAWKIKKLFF